MSLDEYMTTQEISAILGISERRVIALVHHVLKPRGLAAKKGHAWMIAREGIELIRERKPGNPKHKK